MSGTCTVDFVKGSSWPINITINVNQKILSFNTTRSDSCKLERFLKNKHSTLVGFDVEQDWFVFFRRINDVAPVEVRLAPTIFSQQHSVACAVDIYMDSGLVHDLDDKIHAVKFTEQEYVDKTPQPQPVINPLAGAERRRDDNLRSIFG